jgi:CubicO group peptidase (beta-lactamase class C family)
MSRDPLRGRLLAFAPDRVPGLAVAVVGPEGVRDVGVVGFADVAARTEATSQMVCPWFSMTKIVTATTTMRLAEKQIIDLDAPVLDYVPVFETMRPGSRAALVTPRHLLSHSAGLANPIPVRWVHAADRPAPDPDAFLEAQLAKHDKLRFDPGTRSSYSNLSTLVLGAAISSVTGTPFVEVVREEILDPLGMRQTGFTYTAEMDARAAVGYHPYRSPMRLLLPRWVSGQRAGRWVSLKRFLVDGAPYGGLVGSLDDAARFLQMHLRGGELDGVRIIGADAAARMQQVTIEGRRVDLGLGWFRPADQRRADPAFVEHLGGGAGFFDLMRIYPSRGIGVAVMGNATKYDIDAVARMAIGS